MSAILPAPAPAGADHGTVITRTTKQGEKRYYAALWIETPDGDRKQIWKTFDRKKDAEVFLDDESKKAREGEYIEPSPMRFEQFAADWIEKYPKVARKPLKPSTLAGYISLVDKHLKPFFGQMRLRQIRPATIDKDFRAQLPDRLAVNTRRNIFMILRTMLQSAAEWDLLPANPFVARRRVRVPATAREKRGRALPPEEINKLLSACGGETRVIVATTLLTGMRRGEVFGLDETDIDLEKNLINVRRAIYFKQGKAWKPEECGPVFVAPKSAASVRTIDISPCCGRCSSSTDSGREHQKAWSSPTRTALLEIRGLLPSTSSGRRSGGRGSARFASTI